jgi:DnaJ-class molecular chaperone
LRERFNNYKEEVKQLYFDKAMLTKENAQLKAQLQNCDKASHVERKPHVCPVCSGKGETIYNASGYLSTDFHTLHSRLSRINDAGQMFVKCNYCNGTGIV